MQLDCDEAIESFVPGFPQWYSAYCAAMLERDREKTMSQIECAQQAIQARVSELRSAAVNVREIHDLCSALTNLEMLSQRLDSESERVLWD